MNKIFILDLLSKIYTTKSAKEINFEWCTNLLSIRFSSFLDEKCPEVLDILYWDYSKIIKEYLHFDAYIKNLNCILIIDDKHKFTSYRLATLKKYQKVNVAFDIEEYESLCNKFHLESDNYQKDKKRTDFNFIGGANAKRALIDVFLDLKPLLHSKLNPTIRLHEWEIENISSHQELDVLINSKLKQLRNKNAQSTEK
jgi:hypothetical protein